MYNDGLLRVENGYKEMKPALIVHFLCSKITLALNNRLLTLLQQQCEQLQLISYMISYKEYPGCLAARVKGVRVIICSRKGCSTAGFA